jgi:hypothetical protein
MYLYTKLMVGKKEKAKERKKTTTTKSNTMN